MNKRQKIWIFLVLAAAAAGLFAVSGNSVAAEDRSGFLTEHGLVRYFDPETHEYLTGRQMLNGYWYLFEEEDGAMFTGFRELDEESLPSGETGICYYDESGHLCYGQKYIDGYWYNFAENTGAMRTGFVEIPSQSKTCYYDENGHMLYGEQVIDGVTYTFEKGTGALLDPQ